VRVPRCHAIGCLALTLDTELFCERHVVMVESDTRRILARTFRPNKRPSKILEDMLALAQREILAFQHNGHKSPREQPFEWGN